MKRVWGQIAAVTGVFGVGGLLTPACTHNDSEIFIRDVLLQPLISAGQNCTFTSDPTQAALSAGILDVGLAASYRAWILVGNQTVAQGNSTTLQTETSIVEIEYAVVRVTTTDGTQLSAYTYSTSASISEAVGSVPSFSAMQVELVDQQAAESSAVQSVLAREPHIGEFSVRVISYTRVYGHTLGGQSVQSNEFSFPVDICYGCRVGHAAATSTGGTASMQVPCTPGQDSIIDCSQCGGADVCCLVCTGFVCPGTFATSDAGTAPDTGPTADTSTSDTSIAVTPDTSTPDASAPDGASAGD